MVGSSSRLLRLGMLAWLLAVGCRAGDTTRPAQSAPSTGSPSTGSPSTGPAADDPNTNSVLGQVSEPENAPTTPEPSPELIDFPSAVENDLSSSAVQDPMALDLLPIVIDGSSTVFPITEAIVTEFERRNPATPVRLGVSGTGGGFEKFCRGKIDIADASRPIKELEAKLCRENDVQFIELPVAFDGVSVVVHNQNHWSSCLTVEELKRLWAPSAEGRLEMWSQLRRDWPEQPITLFGPGKDSGTFDYFTRAIVGREGACRGDFTASEDDYLLAQGVARDPFSLGFFGYAYYREYRDRLRLVAIDSGAGCVLPSEETISAGSYRPLSRPIFIYVRQASLERPTVRDFVRLYLTRAPQKVAALGYVALPRRAYGLAQQRIENRTLGSVFDGGSQVGLSIEQLLDLESGSD